MTKRFVLCHLLLLVPLSVLAQTAPDAGALRQQIEQHAPTLLPPEQQPLAAPPPEYKPAAGLVVTVKAFQFTGNHLLTDVQLAAAVASYLNRPLDFAGLQQAAAAVSEAYRTAGWLVRVYLPRQDITSGVVSLQIIEGIFGKLQLSQPLPKRLDAAVAQRFVAAAQPVDAPLNAAALDRALLLIDDLPGVVATGNLVPGAGPAQTDLQLKLADEPLLNSYVNLDNTGSRSTGAQRLTADVYANSPLQIGDQLAANLIHTQGSDFYRVIYGAPVGANGLRLSVNASRLDYKVITPEFLAANIEGSSSTWGLDAQYPLIRGRTHNLYLSATYDDKSYDNLAAGQTMSNYGVRDLTFGLLSNYFDKWGGGGANMASLTLTAGDLDLSGSPNQAADAATTATNGSFTKLRYTLSRQQAITTNFSLYGVISGQWADKNLDSSEKFYLGGASGVRAYPASEAGGAQGSLFNLELRYRLLTNLVLTGFYDWGCVTVNTDNNYAGAPLLNQYNLDGAGLALAWSGPKGLTLKAVYARRLSDNPGADTITGNDQDGSLVRDRFWLTASLPF